LNDLNSFYFDVDDVNMTMNDTVRLQYSLTIFPERMSSRINKKKLHHSLRLISMLSAISPLELPFGTLREMQRV